MIGAAIGKSYFRAVETAEARSARLGRQWQETNKKLAATGAVIKYKTLLGRLREKQTALGRSSTRLGQGIHAVEARYQQAKRQAKSYGIEIGRVVQEHRRLTHALKETEMHQRALAGKQAAASRLGALRGRMLGLAGAAYGASRLIGSAMAREEQGLYLRTVINARDGDRDAAVSRARRHARAFSRKSLASEKEVLNIEYALNSAGLREETARAGSELVHKLAKVTRGLPEQVGEIFATTMKTMGGGIEGTAQEKMKTIGNILAKTQFKFQIRDFGQLGESLKYASAAASSAKLSLEQTAAVIGQLNSAGLQGSMAGTAFAGVLRNLTKASGKMGFEIVRDDKGELDLIATLGRMKALMADMDTDQRGDLLQKLFGDEGKRAIVPLLDQLGQLKTAYAEVADAARSSLVDDEYDRFKKSASGQWTALKQNLVQIGDVFAGTLLPALNMVLSPVVKLAGWAASCIERFPVLGKAIGVIGASLVGVGAAMGVAATAAWAWNAAMTVAINRRIVLGVRAIGGALWGLARGAFPAVIAGTRTLGAAMMTGARAGMVAAGGAIKSFAGALVGLASRAIPIAIGGLRALGVAMMSNPIGLIVGAIATAAFLIYEYWTPIKGFFGRLWGGVKTVFKTAWEWIKTIFLNFTPYGLIIKHWRPITGFFGNLWDSVKAVFGAAWDSIAAVTTGWGQSLFSIGRSIIDGLIGGITAGIIAVEDTIGHIGSSIVGGVKEFFGIKSPSRVLMGLGRHLSQGLALGIGQGEAGIVGQMRRIRSVVAKPLAIAPMRLAAPALIAASAALPAPHATPPAHVERPTGHVIHHAPHYSITINTNASGGEDRRNLEAAIKRALEEHDAWAQADLRRLLHD